MLPKCSNGSTRTKSRFSTRALLVCLCVCAGWLTSLAVQAQTAPKLNAERVVTADAVKAAYLYKLRNYVEWPVSSGRSATKVVIGVVGAAEIAERLAEMVSANERLNNSVFVRRLRVGDSVEGVGILYIDDASWRKSSEMVAQATSRSVLVVTDSVNALNAGSTVNFRWVDERVRFEISLDAADEAGVKLNSQLVALAINVVKEKRK